jgi:hypothetical protein
MNGLIRVFLLACASVTMWDQIAPAAAAGGAPDGLYIMTRFWSGNSSLEIAAYRFHEGTVVVNPITSPKTVDAQLEIAAHPKDIGTYRLDGGQFAITLPGGNQQSKLEPSSNGCFSWNGGLFCPVKTFTPGTTLDGTFSGGASISGGASSSTITFKSDGTYDRKSAGTISSKGATTYVSGGSAGTEHGKYRIDGTALHMIPDGGKETVVSTFPYDDGTKGPAPRRMYLGGLMLKRAN